MYTYPYFGALRAEAYPQSYYFIFGVDMKKKILVILISVIAIAALLVGCSESYKTKGVDTDTSDKTIVSNGGLAVKYGKYLYYINGYAGNTVENEFGKVQKGAIARVELDSNGNPIKNTNTVVVSKNVYNTVATSGLYIVDDYIYFSSPSLDKNKNGEPKTSEMWLMRSRVDGTGTEVIKKFSDYTAVYKVASGNVIYFLNGELRVINLNSKEFDDTLVADSVSAQYMTQYSAESNEFIDTVFYLKASEVTTNTNNVLWAYRAGQSPVKLIEANSESYTSGLEHYAGYTLAITEAHYVQNGIRLIYTKTDAGTYKKSVGSYSYDFSAEDLSGSQKFDCLKEVRYSLGKNYSGFRFLDESNALILSGTNYALLSKGADGWANSAPVNLITLSAAPTVFDVRTVGSEIIVYYINSSVLYRISVLEKTETGYSAAIKPASKVFKSSYNSSWIIPDAVGDNLYFFNSNIANNIYYLNYISVVARDDDSMVPTLLGMVTSEDEIKMFG